jgi:hypothetical protein
MIAVTAQREQRAHLRGHAGRGGERGAAPFKRRDAFLECGTVGFEMRE